MNMRDGHCGCDTGKEGTSVWQMISAAFQVRANDEVALSCLLSMVEHPAPNRSEFNLVP